MLGTARGFLILTPLLGERFLTVKIRRAGDTRPGANNWRFYGMSILLFFDPSIISTERRVGCGAGAATATGAAGRSSRGM